MCSAVQQHGWADMWGGAAHQSGHCCGRSMTMFSYVTFETTPPLPRNFMYIPLPVLCMWQSRKVMLLFLEPPIEPIVSPMPLAFETCHQRCQSAGLDVNKPSSYEER